MAARSWRARAIDPRDPREIAELRTSDYYRCFGLIGLTIVTGGVWLLVRPWWRRRPRNKRAWIIAAVVFYALILLIAWFVP